MLANQEKKAELRYAQVNEADEKKIAQQNEFNERKVAQN